MNLNQSTAAERRVTERLSTDVDVEFLLDADILSAQSVNVSKTGMSFTTPGPLKVIVRAEIAGKKLDRHARLVRVTCNGDGLYTFGLEFDRKES